MPASAIIDAWHLLFVDVVPMPLPAMIARARAHDADAPGVRIVGESLDACANVMPSWLALTGAWRASWRAVAARGR